MVQGICRRGPLFGLALCCSIFLPSGLVAQTLAAATPKATATAVTSPAAAEIQAVGQPLPVDEARTRFVIGLEKPVAFQVSSLSNPNRVVVDLPDVRMELPVHDGNKPTGLVKSFRAGLSAPGRSRVVIEVGSPVVVETTKLEVAKDGRTQLLSIVIVAADQAKTAGKRAKLPEQPSALGAAGVQPPLPKPAERPRVRQSKAFKPVIVIDPGHGGHDSGAQKHGTIEKDVVLAFGKTLRAKLESSGRYKVLMTRDTDTFVDLDERLAFGERNNAALFIAVHADYASTKARGATIYSLKDSVAKGLKQSATRDVADKVLSSKEVEKVKAASGDVDTIRSILRDLAGREVDATKERTSVFTRSVIEEMGASTSMRDDPDQQAAFRVLKTAQFPSVLIELAYVSNVQDAKNLKSDMWRDKVADSIVTAVDNYFSNQLARLPM